MKPRPALPPRRRGPLLTALAALAPLPQLMAQEPAEEDVEARLERLELQNEELEQQLEILAGEIERFELRDVMPTLGERRFGLDRAASKVYSREQGLSIGGYGEMLYQSFSGDERSDEIDFVRAVVYVGYKFDERWVFNSEIEFEHAKAGEGEAGSVSMEFAYLDYLSGGPVNLRAGLVLVPMGLINEQHEPTSYLSPTRPLTETFIVPSTWRENGVGAFGEAGPFAWRAYLVNGLDASGFSAGGIRGGRQNGSEALAEDFAAVGRVDWVGQPGLVVGASAYHGDSGQGAEPLGDVGTTVLEAHVDYRWRGLWVRGLAAMAELDDVATLNQGLGLTGEDSVGEELRGAYVTLGYDLMTHLAPDGSQSLTPFVRWETIDTQASVPDGFAADPARDDEVLTYGINYEPIDQIVFKLAYSDFDRGDDRLSFQMGYVF